MPKGVHQPVVTLPCARCGRNFTVIGSKKHRIYCSRDCSNPPRPPTAERPCGWCGKMFTPRSHHEQRCCSTSCSRNAFNADKRKANQNAGLFADYREAKSALLWNMAACQECGWKAEPAILELHHIDRNRRNNHLSNLKLLCPNCHTLGHYRSKTGQFANNLGRS
jgi:hypothetical protein